MADIRVERMAKVLVEYSLKIKKGDQLVIDAPTNAMPLIKEVYRIALKRGAHVDVLFRGDELDRIFIDTATEDQLQRVALFKKVAMTVHNKYLTIFDGFNTREMSGASAEKIKLRARAQGKMRAKFFKRMDIGEVDWCGTLFPTVTLAQEANMSLEAYEAFVYGACFCDKTEPIKYWEAIAKKQAKIVKFLNKIKHFHVIAKDTDIQFDVTGRKWISCDGCKNFPDGEVFTGPIENSANGKIRFSFPGIYMGQEIEDIRLEFKNGKVVKASAAKGQEILEQLLDTDHGARFVGELAIGTNYGINKFTKEMLFDEKIGGTIHVAVGSGFGETGSKNHSTIHWDMLCDMRKDAKIIADGKVIYKNGKFVTRL